MIKALQFATKMHEGQVRKYTGEAYITHPVAVADLVEAYLDEKGFSEEEVMMAIQVAILHDTVEDTVATMEDIEALFGPEIAKGVWFMTKTPMLGIVSFVKSCVRCVCVRLLRSFESSRLATCSTTA